jgi:hypothetical protein
MADDRTVTGKVKITTEGTQALDDFDRKIKKITGPEHKQGLAATVTAISTTFSAVVQGVQLVEQGIERVTAFGAAFLEAGMKAERTKATWTALLPTVGAVSQRIEELYAFGRKAPFEMTGIQTAAIKLEALGLYSARAMKAAGDAAAIFSTDISEASRAMAAGLNGEIEGLKQYGISTVSIAEELGHKVKAINERTAQDTDEIWAAIVSLMEKRGKDGMTVIMGTTAGMLTNYKDAVAAMQREVGGGLMEGAKSGLALAMDTMEKMFAAGTFKQIGEDLGLTLSNAIIMLQNLKLPEALVEFSHRMGTLAHVGAGVSDWAAKQSGGAGPIPSALRLVKLSVHLAGGSALFSAIDAAGNPVAADGSIDYTKRGLMGPDNAPAGAAGGGPVGTHASRISALEERWAAEHPRWQDLAPVEEDPRRRGIDRMSRIRNDSGRMGLSDLSPSVEAPYAQVMKNAEKDVESSTDTIIKTLARIPAALAKQQGPMIAGFGKMFGTMTSLVELSVAGQMKAHIKGKDLFEAVLKSGLAAFLNDLAAKEAKKAAVDIAEAASFAAVGGWLTAGQLIRSAAGHTVLAGVLGGAGMVMQAGADRAMNAVTRQDATATGGAGSSLSAQTAATAGSRLVSAGVAPQAVAYNFSTNYYGSVVYGQGGTADWFYREIVPLIQQAVNGGFIRVAA